MSYRIEKEGYEMYGFKLGQMTNQGRIIGFDENDRQYGIVVECSSNNLIRNSICITIVLEGCEDCKYEYVNKNLIEQPKISIRHAIWNTTLIVQTLHCNHYENVSKGVFELFCSDSTQLNKHHVYLGCAEGNCNTDTYHFNTQAEAQSYLDTLLELVEMVNNPVPVVDLSNEANVVLGKYKVEITPYKVILTDMDGYMLAQYGTRYLPKETIKQQLEQILKHLGVNAEVRI